MVLVKNIKNVTVSDISYDFFKRTFYIMAKKKIIIFFVLIILLISAFLAGLYFKDDVIKFYNNFNKEVEDLKKADVGQVISEAKKQVLLPSPLNIGGTSNNVILLKSQIISETNLQRLKNGDLPALKENAKLSEAAAAKAKDLFTNQYFEHVSPTGIDPGQLVQNYGYDYIVEGENLILGNFLSEQEVVDDWMNSPEHKANILNKRYTEIGVAIVKGIYKDQTVWIGVQEFGLPLSTCVSPSSNFKKQIDYNNTQLDTLSSQIDDRKKQLDSTNQNSPTYNQMMNDYNQLVTQYNSLAETTKEIISQYNNQVNTFNNCVNGN